MKMLKALLHAYWLCLVSTFKAAWQFLAGIMMTASTLSWISEEFVFITTFGTLVLIAVIVGAALLWVEKVCKFFWRRFRNRGFATLKIRITNTDTGERQYFTLHMPKEILNMTVDEAGKWCFSQLKHQVPYGILEQNIQSFS